MKRSQGFTLVELMIVVALGAILVTVAVPAYRSLVQNSRAATQSNSLIAAINTARSYAIKERRPVLLCSSDDQSSCTGTAWQDGWLVAVDRDENGAADPGEQVKVFSGYEGNSTLTAQNAGGGGVTQVQFQSNGFTDVTTFQLRIPECTGNKNRDIRLNAAGQVTTTEVACP